MRRMVVTCLVGTALHAWPAAGQEDVPVIAVVEVESESALLPAANVRVAIESALMEMPGFTTLKRKDLAALLEESETSLAGTPVVGYIAVSSVGPRAAVAQILYARRPLGVGDHAAALAKGEGKQLERMLAAMARTAARQERACENARKRVRRYCPGDPDSRRCRNAEAAVEANCDIGE